MQRSGRPNRQPHSSSSTSTPSRGRGRGRGTAPTHSSRPPRPSLEHASVPAFSSLHPGTGVSIILKADQPTGHQVRGLVADVLTRGDHPRGVKVRLRDGRVGRVQKLVSETEGERGEALVGGAEAGLGRDGGRAGGRVERDVREEDGYLFDEGKSRTGDEGYFAALEEADRRHEVSRGRGAKGVGGGVEAEVVVCPVCGEFEGDEMAVAHHVEGHFAE